MYVRYQAVQSFNKPADIVITPTLVRSNFNSAKIRANTGKAYMCVTLNQTDVHFAHT